MVSDDSDLEEVYNTERHLMYVSCTRARYHLLVTSGGAPSRVRSGWPSSRNGSGFSSTKSVSNPDPFSNFLEACF